ncbi:hypothetical protein [Bradyrhizobium sp. NP1]|uniref:hypothetical protein n=1 Tax=Bradyrhizobium sp. NP1 TaxID=3049772 RepID=UPI0025A5A826|nr:hypothetical protein [Bradyrhizobium sp. NP1]WJR80972.1 hypothetical protein QOU61_14800 [Bradyrhizobium sp. NP1]
MFTANPDRTQHVTLAVWLVDRVGIDGRVSVGYLLAALLLIIAAGTELEFGIDAGGKSLESIAAPLSK